MNIDKNELYLSSQSYANQLMKVMFDNLEKYLIFPTKIDRSICTIWICIIDLRSNSHKSFQLDWHDTVSFRFWFECLNYFVRWSWNITQNKLVSIELHRLWMIRISRLSFGSFGESFVSKYLNVIVNSKKIHSIAAALCTSCVTEYSVFVCFKERLFSQQHLWNIRIEFSILYQRIQYTN